MRVQKLAQRNAHRLFDVAWLFDVTGNAEQLCARIVGTAYACKP